MNRTTLWLAMWLASCVTLTAQTDGVASAWGDTLLDWQEQILEQVDADEFSDAGYDRLMEMLGDLATTPRTRSSHLKQQLTLRADRCLSVRDGYRDPTAERRDANRAYLGDARHTTLRWRMERGAWQAGVVGDKDGGERWRDGAVHAFLLYNKEGRAKVVAGHYRLRLGSGLVVNQQFSMGKQLSATAFMQTGTTVAPHSSTDEYAYMQGVAAELHMGRHWVLLPFVSARRMDGNLQGDTLTSLKDDGMFRLRREVAQRHTDMMTLGGVHAMWHSERMEVGTSVTAQHLDHPWVRPQRRYNTNYYRGDDLTNVSVDWHIRQWGVEWRGELAVDDRGGWATVGALSRRVGEAWRAMVLYRIYANRYRQMWGNAVTEASAMQGERGVLAVVEGEPWRHWKLNFTADCFHFTQPQYGCYASSRGYEISGRASYSRSRWDVVLHYKLKQKDKNNTLTTDVDDDVTHYIRQTLDGVLTVRPVPSLRLRSQVRSRFYSQQNIGGLTTGIAASQSVAWSPHDGRVMLDGQATWFRTDDYDTRVYLTERNVLYGFGLPMLQGEGLRLTLTARCKIVEWLTAEGKYAMTRYAHQSEISSGLQRIDGNVRHDLWLQLRVRF